MATLLDVTVAKNRLLAGNATQNTYLVDTLSVHDNDTIAIESMISPTPTTITLKTIRYEDKVVFKTIDVNP